MSYIVIGIILLFQACIFLGIGYSIGYEQGKSKGELREQYRLARKYRDHCRL